VSERAGTSKVKPKYVSLIFITPILMAWAIIISICHITTYKRLRKVAEGFILLSSAVCFLSQRQRNKFFRYGGNPRSMQRVTAVCFLSPRQRNKFFSYGGNPRSMQRVR
jgi:hypothetical protein